MSSAWMLTVVLCGPPVEASAADAESVASVRSVREWREVYSEAISRSAPRAEPVLEDVVPELVALYVELGEAPGLPRAEANRMRRGLEYRLEQFRGRLSREVRRQERDGRTPRSHPRRNEELAGGGDVGRAAELIELIQNTIAPDTWAVNGGQGTIMYYGPLKVLVVRQTGEVHHQLGGTIRALRR